MTRDYLTEALELLHRVTHEVEVLKERVAEQDERIQCLEGSRSRPAG